MTSVDEKKEHRAYKRDYLLHQIMMTFAFILIGLFLFLLYQIVTKKPPPPPDINGVLTNAVFYEQPDNRKELKLESTHDQH